MSSAYLLKENGDGNPCFYFEAGNNEWTFERSGQKKWIVTLRRNGRGIHTDVIDLAVDRDRRNFLNAKGVRSEGDFEEAQLRELRNKLKERVLAKPAHLSIASETTDKDPRKWVDTEPNIAAAIDVCRAGLRENAVKLGLYENQTGIIRVGKKDVKQEGILQERIAAAPLTVPGTEEALARTFRFRNGEGKEVPPPRKLAEQIKDGLGGLPWLHGVVPFPVRKPDGTFAMTPGYEPTTGTYYAPVDDTPLVLPEPTLANAKNALARLRDFMCDVEFKAEAHFSVWAAAFLTNIARHSIAGAVPMTACDANIAGAGKTLTVNVISLILTGAPVYTSAFPKSEEEMQKYIATAASSGTLLVCFDNARGALGSESLEGVLTSGRFRARLLGGNTFIECQFLATVFLTGNNLQFSSYDQIRRTLLARIETASERPELRTGFKHGDLAKYALAHRQELLVDGMTILAAHASAGYPQADLRAMGTYDEWSRIVRQAIVWVGAPDPALTQEDLLTFSDQEGSSVADLVLGIEELDKKGAGLTSNEIRQLAASPQARIRNAFLNLLPATRNEELPSAQDITKLIKKFRGRPIKDKQIVQEGSSNKGILWFVRSTKGARHGA